MSTVFKVGRFKVESGFIAARTTSISPVVIPPSVPPASEVSRLYELSFESHVIASCARLPRRDAVSNASPISTPLTA